MRLPLLIPILITTLIAILVLFVDSHRLPWIKPLIIALLIVQMINRLKSESESEKRTERYETLIIDMHKLMMREQYKIEQMKGTLVPLQVRDSGQPYSLLFGSNTLINTPNVLVVGDSPLITMRVRDGRLLISATVYNESGKVIALIQDNEWILKRENAMRIQAELDSLKVWDERERLIIDCQLLSNRTIKLNGIFRKDGSEVIATDEGLQISASGGAGVALGSV